VSVRYIELADYLAIATKVTGLDTNTLIRVTKVDLAESALHAPAAGFGETEFYPDFIDKAAVLVVRLAKNHPLPDGNKRAAWVALRLFIEINDWTWKAMPTVNDAEQAVLAIAAGTWNQDDASAWLRGYLAPASTVLPPDEPGGSELAR
jgi:death-on-curing protein